MQEIKLNETPVRTSRNFQINNVKLDINEIPEKIGEFKNVNIKNETSKISISDGVSNSNLTYGLNEILEKQINENANQKYKIIVDSKTHKNVEIDFKFDSHNLQLVDNIEIIAEKDSKATITIKYETDGNSNYCYNKDIHNYQDDSIYYHNGAIRVIAKENSNLNVIVVNLLNTKSNNFISMENEMYENSKIKYTIVDFGGKHSITNYYSNLIGDSSNNILNSIYLGKESQTFDLNYIGELRGEKSNIDIEVQGALKDESKKKFKGTIDFKKGAKKSKGNENEFCMLLSDKAKSIALPMLLCSEEDVEGNHSSSSGKVGEKELFYIMSRGFEYKEAMKLMVRANFNKILENIKNEELRNKIIDEIDKRLD